MAQKEVSEHKRNIDIGSFKKEISILAAIAGMSVKGYMEKVLSDHVNENKELIKMELKKML